MRTAILLVLTVALGGCTHPIVYAPQTDDLSPAEAMYIVQKSIEQQSGDHVPHRVEVTAEKIVVTKVQTQILYFRDLWKSDLHSRRNYFVVRFWDSKGHSYRYYLRDRGDAERLIDAIHVLAEENRMLAELPEPERARRVRHIEQQRKVLELDVSEGPPR